MFVKLVVVACSVALASAAYNGPLAGGQPAHLFPAGVDPKACPNFPNCENPAVAVNQVPATQFQRQYQPQAYEPRYQAQPQFQPQQYQAQPQYQPQQYQAQPQYQAYQPQPQQYAPQPAAQQQYPPEIQNALDRGEYIGDGDYHGEGLAEALAPEYAGAQQQQYAHSPAAYNQAGAYNAIPAASHYAPAAAHAQPAVMPAGVSAQACPNYPFCH